MTEPVLVPRDALVGANVGISVSESADLARLGLRSSHCRLAVVELARAVLLAGGTIVYGGDLRPDGFTTLLLDEVRSYAHGRGALLVCLSADAHHGLTDEAVDDVDRRLGADARLVLVNADGQPVRPGDRPAGRPPPDPPSALTGLRRHMTAITAARVVVGGRLTGYKGRGPGVVEEAALAVDAGLPVYAAGGFGGAALCVARALGADPDRWAPPGLPVGADDDGARQALDALAETIASRGAARDGLDEDQRRALAATHRPGEIASLAVLGLSRARLGGPA
ncbi:hypothetical protein [Candidatus Blastococcus massiliensis]|uniref:hypothetical protein n=1 Tax=Candidatus Blastococcus massiliensis TaxID=1470358 RepID=UPI0004B9C778|nr:hypothetical protein [Candidatus Blastococcus massiliensis]